MLSSRACSYQKSISVATVPSLLEILEFYSKKGVKTYCNPQAVFEYALHGQGDYQSCPLEMHNELRPYYHAAKNYYDAKANMEAIEYKIAKAKGRLSEVKSREMSDYYRGIIIENSELLSQAGRNLNQEEIKLKQFKKDNF